METTDTEWVKGHGTPATAIGKKTPPPSLTHLKHSHRGPQEVVKMHSCAETPRLRVENLPARAFSTAIRSNAKLSTKEKHA